MTRLTASPTVAEQVEAYFAEHPRGMTMVAARELGIPELEVVRHMPVGTVTELRPDSFADLLHRLTEFGKVHVIVSNGTTTIETVGVFGGFSTWGGFHNVQTDSLDMHIRGDRITSIFAVEKPSHHGRNSTLSFQLFDDHGQCAFKIFINFGDAPTHEQRTLWDAVRKDFIHESRR